MHSFSSSCTLFSKPMAAVWITVSPTSRIKKRRGWCGHGSFFSMVAVIWLKPFLAYSINLCVHDTMWANNMTAIQILSPKDRWMSFWSQLVLPPTHPCLALDPCGELTEMVWTWFWKLAKSEDSGFQWLEKASNFTNKENNTKNISCNLITHLWVLSHWVETKFSANLLGSKTTAKVRKSWGFLKMNRTKNNSRK